MDSEEVSLKHLFPILVLKNIKFASSKTVAVDSCICKQSSYR